MENGKWLRLVLLLSILYFPFSVFIGCGQKGSSAGQKNVVAQSSILLPQDLGQAPDFTLQTPEGETLSFAQFQGKIALIDFWATWCPPCQEEIPGFIDLYTRYKDKGLEIIGIALDTTGPEGVKKFIEEFAVNYPIVMGDREIIKAYGGIRAIPTTFLVNAKGRIVKRYIGMHSADEFEQDISNLLLTSS